MIDIGILIFDDVEELDFVGPWEVWNMVNMVSRFRGEADPFRVRFCLLYTSPSPRDLSTSRMPSSA